ncbi:MAG TPA: hypothetical protein PK812_04200 [Beijerinckiaceae bacterium]|nr:hypothetical protein [Beijerinckiaceae bacterium]
MIRPEVTELSHDLLQEKVRMAIVFKNHNGETLQHIQLVFPLHMDLQDTELKLKQTAIEQARKFLRAAADGL